MRAKLLTSEARFKNVVTVFLAGLTVLGSLVVSLNVRASQAGAEASRDSRVLAARYLTHLGRSQWETAAEKRLMVAWQELGGLMMQSEAYEKMARGKDAVLNRIVRERLTKIRDRLAAEGEVTKPPYFNAQSAAFDFLQFYLDRVYVPAAELLERQEQKKRESEFWSAKAEAYTTALAVMAVAVFLLTLSIVLGGRIRFVMAGAGAALILAVAVAAAATAARGWTGVSEGSIRLLARASSEVTRAQLVLDLGGNLEMAGRFAGQAAADVDEIMAADPGFRAAARLRGRIGAIKGESLFYGGNVEAGRAELATAGAALEAVIEAGADEGYLRWSMAYGDFLRGRPEESLRSAEMALAALPEQKLPLGVIEAAALLRSGRRAEAEAAAERAIAHALARPLASDPIVFRTLIKNLERVQAVDPLAGLPELILRLKEASVCVAFLKTTGPEPIVASAAPPGFVDPVYDDRGEIKDLPPRDVFPRFTARAHFLIRFKGLSRGQSIVNKVFWRPPGQLFWIEQLRLTESRKWDGPDSARVLGTVANPMPEAGEILGSGDYRLEIYLDGHLAASATFKVL